MFDQFISRLKSIGLAQPTRFRVIINPPQVNVGQVPVTIGGNPVLANLVRNAIGGSIGGGDARVLALLCEATTMPGKQILTTERAVYGPTFRMPYGQIFAEWPATFNVDNMMYPKTLFEQWHDLIIDPNTFDVNFYKNYVTDIEIYQLDKRDVAIHGVKLYDAYPVTVNDLELNHGAQDSVHKLNVSFAYRYWKPIP